MFFKGILTETYRRRSMTAGVQYIYENLHSYVIWNNIVLYQSSAWYVMVLRGIAGQCASVQNDPDPIPWNGIPGAKKHIMAEWGALTRAHIVQNSSRYEMLQVDFGLNMKTLGIAFLAILYSALRIISSYMWI